MKYGFVLADIHHGTSNNVGPAVVSLFPEGSGDTLFLFPGGRLTHAGTPEYLRSSVFDYVNRDNLDAAVVWTSTLTGVLSQKEVEEKLVALEDIPHVTIGSSKKEPSRFPDIYFNAYGGMTSVLEHMITRHHAKRIAYLRGPENHSSSEERYAAYLDTLDRHHIKVDPLLVSSPHSWREGGEAVKELLEKNRLVPGKDFDTLVCASDLMLSGALKVLEAEGEGLDPSVLHVCGFNDSLEAKTQSVPCTTVRFPYAAIARKAVDTLHSLLSGEEVESSIRLDMPLVIRKSCGCRGLHLEDAESLTLDRIVGTLSEATGLDASLILTAGEEAFRIGDEKSLRKFLAFLLRNAGDIYAINEAIECFLQFSTMGVNRKERLYHLSRYILPEEIEKASLKRISREKKRQEALNDFKLKLLRVNTLREIQRILTASAPSMGFTEAFLVIQREGDLVLVGDEMDEVFPSRQILPKATLEELKHSSYVVEPLFSEDEVLGHLVLGIGQLNGSECEDVRSAVSSAVRSSLLFEQTKQAKEVAEKTEYDRTVFFSSVKEKLREPIDEIVRVLDSGKTIGKEDRKALLKSLASSRHIIDLALSTANEQDMDFQMVDATVLLSSFLKEKRRLPSLFVDKNKLSDLLSTLKGDLSEMTVSLSARGVLLKVSEADVVSADETYSQNLLLRHGGSFRLSEGDAELFLPYPTLSNKAVLGRMEEGVMACFGTLGNLDVPGVEKVLVDTEEFLTSRRLPPKTMLLYWDSNFLGKDAYSALKILKEDESYARLPFLVEGVPSSKSLLDSIQTMIGPDQYHLLLVGDLFEEKCPWEGSAQTTSVELEKALQKAEELKPAMVVINHLGEKEILAFLESFRSSGKTSHIPVLIVLKTIRAEFVSAIEEYPKTLIATNSILSSEDFSKRIRSVLAGEQILPVYSGAIVKKAQVYLSQNYMNQISRWQVADSVHVSEDYLTSIFRKEIGISPWDYLNRVRIEEASTLLKETGMSVLEVSKATGFQGQAYFCTVFKKLTGESPRAMRKKH